MLVRDEAALDRLVAEKMREASQQDYIDWLTNYRRLADFADDQEIDPTNAARQMGQPMTHQELEQRLLKLNPNLRFEGGPRNNHHKVMYVLRPDGLEKLFVYPTGSIPERTIWKPLHEYADDPNYKPSTQDHGSKDWHWGPVEGFEHLFRPDAYKYAGWNDPDVLAANPDMPLWGEWKRVSEDAGRAGWTKLRHAWGREKRGWREVLLMLVQRGLLTPAQVEREFHGDPNNPLWKQGLGKGHTTNNVI